jgi:hypothetical protein
MEIINKFYNISEAKRQTGVNNIIKVCQNKANLAGGFRWMYESDYNNKLIESLLSA